MKPILTLIAAVSLFCGISGAQSVGGSIQQPSTGSGGGPPTGAAGGALTGTYPSPGLASGFATAATCAGSPGNTTGAYKSQCQATSSGNFYTCNNAAGCAVAADWLLVGPGASSGANTALSNLASPTPNATLLPQTGVSLGSATNPFQNVCFYNGGVYGTGSVCLLSTPSGSDQWTVPDRSDTFAGLGTQTFTGTETFTGANAYGTPASIVLTNGSGLPLSGHTAQAANSVVMNATAGTAIPTAVVMPTCTSGADLYNTTTNTWSCVSVGSGANATLSNLSSPTAINQNLLFATGLNLGSATAPPKSLFFYGTGTFGSNSVQITSAPSGNNVWSVPNTAADTFAGLATNQAFTGTQTFSPGNLISAGTTATDSAPLGAELTSSGTTTSTGWTGSYNSYSNGASNTTPLTYAPTIANGSFYQVVITVSGYSAGSIVITFGGVTLSSMSGNSTQTTGPKTTSTAGLVITPNSTFVGTVTASIKLITPVSQFAFLGRDSTSANSLIILQPLASLHNIFLGGGGTYNTTGNNNSANGVSALYSNTTGNNNSANGYNALNSNTTGTANSANGYNALNSNTTGNYNTASGYNALNSNTIGNYNSANGDNALNSNTTGNYNTANGTLTLSANTTGSFNTANGFIALSSNTTGSNNSANGYNALNSNTTGNYNSANGYNALYSNTTGNNNTASGASAGYGTSSTNANTSGSNNSFFGYQAAPGTSTQYTNLTVIGANTTGNNNYSTVVGGHLGSHQTHNSTTISGTGCTLTYGNDVAGLITLSTGATSCTVTFANPFVQPVISGLVPSTTLILPVASATTTALTITVSSASGTVNYSMQDIN